MKTPNLENIRAMGKAIMEEEGDLWSIISQENINISYSEAKSMDPLERYFAMAAITHINKERDRKSKTK